ncbi:glutaredoxin [Ralstonia pickettii]|uniref:glutaredoxin n=1 Tax=Ralstonia pickettii TaxID=329 RepID=UPI000468473F|nr:glutaredoxin [Ralstonia pickettii]
MKTLNVVVLTQDNCAFCDAAIAMLGRLSATYPMAIDTVSLQSKEGEVLAVQGGIHFAPGILMDGEAVCYGRPSERLLRQEIERRLQSPMTSAGT